jgi:ABC-type transporter Mla subunit MlaD
MHETEDHLDADIDELYRLLEQLSDASFDIKGRLTRQSVRLNQIEERLSQISDALDSTLVVMETFSNVQVMHGGRLDKILSLLERSGG